MRTFTITRLISSLFLLLALLLVAYGLFGFSRFVWYSGEYFDERLVLFDNGVYPYILGVVLLVLGQIARLHYRRLAMFLASSTSIAFLAWKRATVPSTVLGQALFPDAELLNELMLMAAVLLVLTLLDYPIDRVIRKVLNRDRV